MWALVYSQLLKRGGVGVLTETATSAAPVVPEEVGGCDGREWCEWDCSRGAMLNRLNQGAVFMRLLQSDLPRIPFTADIKAGIDQRKARGSTSA